MIKLLLTFAILFKSISCYATSYIELKFKGIIKQESDSTCGIASLSNILSTNYLIKKNELDLLNHLRIKPEYSFKDLSLIASKYQINTLGVKLPLSQLSNINTPAILHINRLGVGHFVILKNITPTYVQVSDPAWGNLNYTHAQFEKYWTRSDGLGRALIFLTPIKSTSTQPEIYKKIVNAEMNNF
jgi:uncharacterized protein